MLFEDTKFNNEKMLFEDFIFTEKFMKVAKDVWENMEDGKHAFIPFNGLFVTIVPEEDEDGESYLVVALVEKIDFLGYPWSEYLAVTTFDKNDIIAG